MTDTVVKVLAGIAALFATVSSTLGIWNGLRISTIHTLVNSMSERQDERARKQDEREVEQNKVIENLRQLLMASEVKGLEAEQVRVTLANEAAARLAVQSTQVVQQQGEGGNRRK